ncbi:MAG: hypothetical protein ACE5QW_09465 [Thermoplasmata archaeon]
MELAFLPTYSSNLKRMEEILRRFHSHITKNLLHTSSEALFEATERDFDPVALMPSVEDVFMLVKSQSLLEVDWKYSSPINGKQLLNIQKGDHIRNDSQSQRFSLVFHESGCWLWYIVLSIRLEAPVEIR